MLVVMGLRSVVAYLGVAACLAACLTACGGPRGEEHAETIDPTRVPEQLELDPDGEEQPPDAIGGIPVTAKARWRIAARVLSRERYYRGWRADVSPVDLALGWGALSDPAVDRYIDWHQGDRWYFWQWSAGSPYQNDAIRRQSANVHVVPGSDNLRRAVLALEPDDVVQLKGWLVNLQGPERDGWNTSLTRTDKGNHSCEIMYVTELADSQHLYR